MCCRFHTAFTSHGVRHGSCTAPAAAGKRAVVVEESAHHSGLAMSVVYAGMSEERLRRELDDVFPAPREEDRG